MSPAGYWPQLYAAIEAGADSVYFGLKHFTARAKVGFSLAELPEVFRTLHRRGVRGFVTFNTLVFEHELAEAGRALAAILDAGADALIIQDAATMRLARRIAPDAELHASTQMSVTDAAGVRFAQSLGASRVTLARELSLDEIRSIRVETACELEIFVHGALCVAYSGQCFSSEAWGGRSANRGQCAQACRLPYDMIVDGERRDLGDARYLLSPGDLYALHQVPEIVRTGIAALKIEGRYKDADYVALTTSAYRKAVDEAWAGMPLSITPADELRLEQVYSRGFGPYFLTGANHQAVVRGRAPRHRGVLAGRVVRASADTVLVELSSAIEVAPLKPGDGVVFDAAGWRSPEEPEEGGRLYSVEPGGSGRLQLRFARGSLNPARIRPGDLLWRTDDPDLARAARPYLEASSPVSRQPIAVILVAHEGEPLRLRCSLECRPDVCCEVLSEEPLAQARNEVTPTARLRDQVDRLGNTPYKLARFDVEIAEQPFIPVSLVNRLRREAVERLGEIQAQPPPRQVGDPASALSFLRTGQSGHVSDVAPRIHLLVRTPEQLDAAIAAAPASITLDYLDLYGLKTSLDRIRNAGLEPRVAAPRVLKPGEDRVIDFLVRLDCPVLVRSAGLLDILRRRGHPRLMGDFSLNAANAISAGLFLDMGLERITPTHDLNAAQVADLARSAGPLRIEAVAYQHLPVFHTEHCVFCRFLSTGTTYKNCGRPCETHSVELQDFAGRRHPVMADVGCRNTVFGAEAQEASAHLERWLAAGIRHFRLEFVHESPEQVARVSQLFRETVEGSKSFSELARELKRTAPQGVTEGSLFVARDYVALPVLQ